MTQARRRLGARYQAYLAGEIQLRRIRRQRAGLINPVRYADSWHLRQQTLRRFVWGPHAYPDRQRWA